MASLSVVERQGIEKTPCQHQVRGPQVTTQVGGSGQHAGVAASCPPGDNPLQQYVGWRSWPSEEQAASPAGPFRHHRWVSETQLSSPIPGLQGNSAARLNGGHFYMGREEALVNLLSQEVAEEVNRRLPPGAAGVIAAPH